MRKIETLKAHRSEARIYRDSANNQYVVRFYTDNVHLRDADYETPDLDDAQITAQVELERTERNIIKREAAKAIEGNPKGHVFAQRHIAQQRERRTPLMRYTIEPTINAAVEKIYGMQGMQDADPEEYMAPRIVNILQALVEETQETT